MSAAYKLGAYGDGYAMGTIMAIIGGSVTTKSSVSVRKNGAKAKAVKPPPEEPLFATSPAPGLTYGEMVNQAHSLASANPEAREPSASTPSAATPPGAQRMPVPDGIRVLDSYVSEHAAAYHADCIEGVKGLPDNSIDFSVFSPPFEGLFVYSASDRDMGNSHGGEQFAKHLAFLAAEMWRVIKPGRLVALHCMDLPTTLTHHGYIGFIDFPARLREVYERAGFIYHCPKVTIWKDPEVAANRTYARQLTYGEMIKDSSMSGVAAPDYILLMRKPGVNADPIVHAGDQLAERDAGGKPRHWQRVASPVWAMPPAPEMVWATANGLWIDGLVDYEQPRGGNPDKRGIDQGDTLNFRAAREHEDERHICPLQIGVVNRLLDLYTNPGNVVLTPFMGIGTEVVCAVAKGRRGVGFELKPSYFRQAVAHIRAAEPGAKGQQTALFEASHGT